MNAVMITPEPAKFVPEVLEQLTFPQWKLRNGSLLYVLLTSPMHLGDPLKNPEPLKEGEKPKDPVTLVEAINLETGELGQFITGSILKDLFEAKFPNKSYVGKSFSILVGEQKDAKTGGGRRYNTYTLKLIKTPDALADVAAKAVAKFSPKPSLDVVKDPPSAKDEKSAAGKK